jgi:hypothetical protein
MSMPQPLVSYFIVLVGPTGQPIASHMVRLVAIGEEDDTRQRLSLMGAFAMAVLGDAFLITSQAQIWAFWENFALPNGFRMVVMEAYKPQEPPAMIEPPAPTPDHPVAAEAVPEEKPEDFDNTPISPYEPGHA